MRTAFGTVTPGCPEDREHSDLAIRLMIREGYPPREAAREYISYRARVREAISSWKTTVLAGLISGVILGISMIGILAIGAVFMWVLQASTSSQNSAQLPLEQVLGFAPAAGATATLLGIVCMGLAAIEKHRRRREGVHVHMRKRSTDTSHLIFQLLLWTFVLGVLAGIIYLYIGSREANAFIGLGIVLGFPTSFVIRYYFYRSYPTILSYVSTAPAGRESRRVVEYELNPKADMPNAHVAPREQRTDPTKYGPAAQRSGSRRIKPRYLAIFLGTIIGWWGLVRWWVWMSSDLSFLPFTDNLTADIIGLGLGPIIGLGLTLFYIRIIEDS